MKPFFITPPISFGFPLSLVDGVELGRGNTLERFRDVLVLDSSFESSALLVFEIF